MKEFNLLDLLNYAEIQYKYALALNSYYTIHKRFPKLVYYDVFSWGKNILYKNELSLSRKEEKDAVVFQSHSALYLLVTQIDTILESIYGKERFRNNNISDISCIVRLIRNAFTHNPFYPKWLISKEYRNKAYIIKELSINISTEQIKNKPVKRMDYGGPTAILKLTALIKKLISGNVPSPSGRGE